MTTRATRSTLGWLAAAILLLATGNLLAADAENNPYPFKADAFETISALTGVPKAKVGEQFFTRSELALLRDAKRGGLASMSLGEALLLASGAANDDDRRQYLRQLDAITDDARSSAGNARSPRELGKLLLKSLHDGPMAEGYEDGQANLVTLLKTQKYNCVSSAALFMIVAERLRLKVRMVEIPEHVYCEAFDGKKWVDVEPTNAHGFAAKPDRKLIADIKARHGYEDGSAMAAEFRYPLNDLQFVAAVYFCHGTLLAKQNHYQAGVASKLFALALNPENPHAVNSTLQEIGRWCDALVADNNNDAALGLAHRYEHVLKNPSRAKTLLAKAAKRPVQQVAVAQ
ncbi:MAG TPA: transglutaminase family protein [Pirellulales bacterium]